LEESESEKEREKKREGESERWKKGKDCASFVNFFFT
jgi:hypothetical protein